MSHGCCGGDVKFDGASQAYKRVLLVVIAVNFVMFLVEVTGGLASGSMALLADSLDFLADSTTYTISLVVIGMSLAVRAKAGLFKGISLLAIAAWVLGSTVYRMLGDAVPEPVTMGAIGFTAFAANVFCALLLMRFKDGDANVRSVWLCSRNDAIGNVAVMLAASGIWVTESMWPDLIVAGGMSVLFCQSAILIIRQARLELQQDHEAHQH
ncbi:cation transporter [Kordiimonas pumila]|uniref:Cation transporter n=1 Tax=Kordiimonas pumila TaxID=2161677 RepID=A0ABV7D6B3_9PROT